jgi:hypothetical protein
LHEAAEPDTVEESQIDDRGNGPVTSITPKEGEMISKLRERITSAHVIALAALFVALGGTAFAAATIGTNDIKDAAVTKKKLHKKSVSKKKIKTNAVNGKKVKDDSLTGDDIDEPTLGTVPSATDADNADTATNADRATDANTIAYGMFEANGTTSADNRVKNLSNANVTHPAPGTYCFEGLSFTALSAMVSGDSGFGFNDTLASVRIATPPGGVLAPCPDAASVRVRTYDVGDALLADRRFLIWFQD